MKRKRTFVFNKLFAFERISIYTIFFPSNSIVPPRIEHEGTLVDTKVKEKHNITLTCEVSGIVYTV